MKEIKYDFAVVGGGIVGLATAYKLQLKYPTLNIIILEKEKELAFHQTGRNSGVIHSGLYYNPGSFRAKNCVDGRKQLVEFAKKNQIDHDVCGKIVLATNKIEQETLSELKTRGEQNGLIGLQIIGKDKIKEIEPFAEGVEALFVPESGIIDYKGVTNKLADLIIQINPNSRIQTSCKVLDVKNEVLLTNQGNIQTYHTVFCGGLFSDRLAKSDGSGGPGFIIRDQYANDVVSIVSGSLYEIGAATDEAKNDSFEDDPLNSFSSDGYHVGTSASPLDIVSWSFSAIGPVSHSITKRTGANFTQFNKALVGDSTFDVVRPGYLAPIAALSSSDASISASYAAAKIADIDENQYTLSQEVSASSQSTKTWIGGNVISFAFSILPATSGISFSSVLSNDKSSS